MSEGMIPQHPIGPVPALDRAIRLSRPGEHIVMGGGGRQMRFKLRSRDDSSAIGSSLTWEGIFARQKAEDRDLLEDRLHVRLGSLTTEQLTEIQKVVDSLEEAEPSDG